MATIERFEEIEAWKVARTLTQQIYQMSERGEFARDYGLRDQMRRAAVSIMSNIAEGKVHAARDRGERLPEGAILDAAARPTTDPADYYTGGTLTPLGGALAGHKGYGLALAAALLGGLAHADGSRPDVTGIASTAGATDGSPRIGGVALIAINPAGFAQDLGYAHLVGGVLASFHDAGAVIPGEFEAARRGAFTELQLEQRAVNTLRELEADLLSEDLSSVRRRSRRGSALSWWRRDG